MSEIEIELKKPRVRMQNYSHVGPVPKKIKKLVVKPAGVSDE